jgi:hypothetical protein
MSAQGERLDSQERRETWETQERRDHQASKVSRERLDSQALKETLETRASRGSQALKEIQEMKGRLGNRD